MPTYVLSKVKRTGADQKIGDLVDQDHPTGALTTLAAADELIVLDVTGNARVFKVITRANLLTQLNSIIGATWGKITGKPSSFPPSAHAHAYSAITGKPSTFPPETHTHDFAPEAVDAIISKLIAPVYTTDGTPVFTPKPIDGDDIRTSETTHYVVTTGQHRGIIHSVLLCNTSASDRAVEVHLVPSGSSRSSSTVIFKDTIFAGETVEIGGPFFLDSSDSLRSIGVSYLNEVAVLATVSEVSAEIDGVGLIATDGITAAGAAAALYTCPASMHAYLANLVLTNTHGTATSIYVEVRPSGGSQQSRQRIVSTSLVQGEQLAVSGVLLDAGDKIYVHASAASRIAVRPSIIEYEAP